MESAYRQFQESKYHDDVNENPNAQTSKGFAEWIEVQTTLGHTWTSSQVNITLYSFNLISPDYHHHNNLFESNTLYFFCAEKNEKSSRGKAQVC
jgi:hypothetical protein